MTRLEMIKKAAEKEPIHFDEEAEGSVVIQQGNYYHYGQEEEFDGALDDIIDRLHKEAIEPDPFLLDVI